MLVIQDLTLVANGECSHVRETIFRASYTYPQTKEINLVRKTKDVIVKSRNAKKNIVNVFPVRKVAELIVLVWDVIILLVEKIYGKTLDLIIVAVLIVIDLIIPVTMIILRLEGFLLI